MPKNRSVMLSGKGQSVVAFDALMMFIELQVRRWSVAQAKAMVLALADSGKTQAAIAESLGITRQAIQARLAAAGHDAMKLALHAFELYDWEANAA